MPHKYELIICDISGEHKPVAKFSSDKPFLPLNIGERFDDHGWERLDGVGRIARREEPIRYIVFACKHVVLENDGELVYQLNVDLQPFSGPRSPAWGQHQPLG